MPLDDTDALPLLPGFALDNAAPLTRAKTDDIPTITVLGLKDRSLSMLVMKVVDPALPAGFKLDSQPHSRRHHIIAAAE